MRLITNLEMAAVSGGAGPKKKTGTPGEDQVVDQVVVIDGTAARDTLQRNDAIASFSCDVLGQGFGWTAGILSLEAGPFVAGLVYEGVSSGVTKVCNNYLDDQKSNDRKMNNR